MTPKEFNEALCRNKFTLTDFAQHIGCQVAMVEGWSSGDLPIPETAIKTLQWLDGGGDQMIKNELALKYPVLNEYIKKGLTGWEVVRILVEGNKWHHDPPAPTHFGVYFKY